MMRHITRVCEQTLTKIQNALKRHILIEKTIDLFEFTVAKMRENAFLF